MHKRTLTTIVTLLTISAARASDIATTLHFDPTLAREANPLASVHGLGVTALITTNIIGVVLFLLIPLFFFWRFASASITDPSPATAREFMCRQLYGRDLSPKEFWLAICLGTPFPKNRLQTLRMVGFVVPWALAVGSFHAALSWWAANAWHWQDYQLLRYTFSVRGYPLMEVASSMISAVCAAIYYSRMEFSAYLRDQQAT